MPVSAPNGRRGPAPEQQAEVTKKLSADEIARVLAGVPIDAEAAPRSAGRRASVVAILITALLVGVATGALVGWSRYGTTPSAATVER